MARYGVFYDKFSNTWAMCIDGRTDRPIQNFKTKGEAMRFAEGLNSGEQALTCMVCGKARVEWPWSTCDECIIKIAEEEIYGGAGGTKRLAKEKMGEAARSAVKKLGLIPIKNEVFQAVRFTQEVLCTVCGTAYQMDGSNCPTCAEKADAEVAEKAAAIRKERMGKPLSIKRPRMTSEE